jgi:hypothetical protein
MTVILLVLLKVDYPQSWPLLSNLLDLKIIFGTSYESQLLETTL